MQDLDPSLPNQFLRFLVPTAAALFDLLVNVAILIFSQPFPVASSVFDQQDLPIRLTDTPHLLKCCNGVEKGAGKSEEMTVLNESSRKSSASALPSRKSIGMLDRRATSRAFTSITRLK